MVRRFCPKCGKNIDTNQPVYENFVCSACFFQDTVDFALPKMVKLTSCHFCPSFSFTIDGIAKDWVQFDSDEEDLEDFVKGLVHQQVLQKIEKKTPLSFEVHLNPDDLHFETAHHIPMELIATDTVKKTGRKRDLMVYTRNRYCPICAAKKSLRFESVLQLRYVLEKDRHILESIVDDLAENVREQQKHNPKNFITEAVPMQHGYDFKFSSKAYLRSMVQMISSSYKVEVKSSQQLVGTDENTGGKRYRLHLAVIILPFEKGEVLNLGGKEYIVKKLAKTYVEVLDVEKERKIKFSYPVLEENF